MKSKSYVCMHCAICFCALSLVYSLSLAQVRFREFREDAARYAYYLERAKLALSEIEFESIIKHAHAFFAAAWERDAEWIISENVRKYGKEVWHKLEDEKVRWRAMWEQEAEILEAKVRGSWLARREALLCIEFDKELLNESLLFANESTRSYSGKERLQIWDDIILEKTAAIAAHWEEKLAQTIVTIRARGDELDAASRAAFEKEINEIDKELRTKFRLEKNNLIYRERNKIIRDEILDLKSLRAAAEQGKASAVADDILARTIESLEAKKTAFLVNPSLPESASQADFSNLGESWETKLRELVESGLSIWRNAQQKFLSEMIAWKQNVEEAFHLGDEAWRNAYKKLVRAYEGWQKDLQNEINLGIDVWKKRDAKLKEELDRAKADFASYLSTTEMEWQEYSAGVLETLIHGSAMLGEADESIDWLREMAERYNKEGVFTKAENLPQLFPSC